MTLQGFEEKYSHLCKEAYDWAKENNYTIEEAWNACNRGDWLLWVAQKVDVDLMIFTKAKALCANTVSHLMKDKRSKNAIKVALAFSEGNATREELDAAADAAYAAAAAAYAAYAADAAYAAYAAAYAAYAATDAAYAAAYAAYATAAAAYAAYAAYAARQQSLKQTAEICKEVLTDAVFEKLKG